MKLFAPLLLVLVCCACGKSQLAPDAVPSYYRHHPFDEDSQTYKLDELTYPGNQPYDPATGELSPEPVRDWTYTDQLGRTFTNKDLLGKTYVIDFFFCSCPTICPKVKQQMLRLEQEFKDEENFRLVSITVDPKRDTVGRLHDYAERLGIADHDRWRFLTGDKLETYELDADYLSIAEENPSAPGGFDHTGRIILVDDEGFVRSFANGTEPEQVTHLMDDVRLLLK